MPELTDQELFELAREIYHLVFHTTPSFRDDNLGADLAYLLGAILERVHVDVSFEESVPPLLALLREKLPPGHAVFSFIIT